MDLLRIGAAATLFLAPDELIYTIYRIHLINRFHCAALMDPNYLGAKVEAVDGSDQHEQHRDGDAAD